MPQFTYYCFYQIGITAPVLEDWQTNGMYAIALDWNDTPNMKISVLTSVLMDVTQDSQPEHDVWRGGSEINQFIDLIEDPTIATVGFYNWRFDDRILQYWGFPIAGTIDLAHYCRLATGAPTEGYCAPNRYGLDDIAKETLGFTRTATQNEASLLWQQGRRDESIQIERFNAYLIYRLWLKRDRIRIPHLGTFDVESYINLP